MYDHVVVGGGIVGAATAWQLLQLRPGAQLLLVDKEPAFGRHQTGHNSGVIHSGIYYQPGSLKAELCRRGAEETVAFAQDNGVPVDRIGKLLVATDEREAVGMAALVDRAVANGIEFEQLDRSELRRREPHIVGVGALFLPATGITDYGQINTRLAELVTTLGGALRTNTEVTGIHEGAASVRLTTTTGDIHAAQVTFCAGLQSDRLARLAGLGEGFRIVPFRGEYFDVVPERAGLVRHLIYPIPDPELPFLGVHLTRTVTGGLNVGPNAVLGLAREGYPKFSVNARDLWEIASFPGMWRVARANARIGVKEMRNSLWKRGYLRECQKYCPELTSADLVPRVAGIRAQAVMRDGGFVHDFLLRRTARTLHVLNAPSPAATSAIPIGLRLAREAIGRP